MSDCLSYIFQSRAVYVHNLFPRRVAPKIAAGRCPHTISPSHPHTLTTAEYVSLSPLERGFAQSRQTQSRTLPAIHEATAFRPVPVAPSASTHLPRRQARAF